MKKNKGRKITRLNNEKQQQFENRAKTQWGEDRYRESTRKWNSYGEIKKEEILNECNSIFQELADNMNEGTDSQVIQETLIKWHQFLQHFYEPSLEVLRGLGEVYNYDPDFRKMFEGMDPDLPDFLQDAINVYVDELEMRWLESQYEVLEE